MLSVYGSVGAAGAADFAPTKSLADVVASVRPEFEALISQAQAWGMQPKIRSAGRTCAQQNEQLKAGYSQAGLCRSMHVLGHAVDLDLVPNACSTYTKLGQWWEARGGVWGGRWTGPQFGPCGDAGHFHMGFNKAQAVPTSVCPGDLSLAECEKLRHDYLSKNLSGGEVTSKMGLVAGLLMIVAGGAFVWGVMRVKPGLKSNPGENLSGIETLRYLLGPPGSLVQIGAESGRPVQDGIVLYMGKHGSYRYVLYEGGHAVAALQAVSGNGRHAQIANVYVVPNRRRQQLAAKLFRRAQQDFKTVSHADEDDLSPAGYAWSRAIKSNPRRRRGPSPDFVEGYEEGLWEAQHIGVDQLFDESTAHDEFSRGYVVGYREAERRGLKGTVPVGPRTFMHPELREKLAREDLERAIYWQKIDEIRSRGVR